MDIFTCTDTSYCIHQSSIICKQVYFTLFEVKGKRRSQTEEAGVAHL